MMSDTDSDNATLQKRPKAFKNLITSSGYSFSSITLTTPVNNKEPKITDLACNSIDLIACQHIRGPFY